MEPVLIGYRTRYTHRKPEWLEAPGVEEDCSVVDHMIRVRGLPRPEFWQHQNRHNAIQHFDSEEIAWTALRDDIQIVLERDESLDPPWRVEIVRLPVQKFDLYAYKILPVQFMNERSEDFKPPDLGITPVPVDYERLGYDAVGWNNWGPFECSPLVCNLEASQQKVNRRCLFDEVEPAVELARRYSGTDWQPVWADSGHCDPSPYCVIEVWRKAQPFQHPPRQGEIFEWRPDLLHRLVEHKIGHGNVF